MPTLPQKQPNVKGIPGSIFNASLKRFSASYYDPMDPRQTKNNPNGIGAFNKPVVFGDVAMGKRKYKQGTLIYVPELKDIVTPHGQGVFRVNDKKNVRYDKVKDESFDFALPSGHPATQFLQSRIGNNKFNFQLYGKK